MKLALKLVLAHARFHPTRILLAATAVVAAACIVVWVVSGYDALVGQFDENAARYLGNYDVLVVPAVPTAAIAPELITAIQREAVVAEANPVVQSRVTVKRAGAAPPPVDGSAKALVLLGGDRPPVFGAPPLDPTLVGTNAVNPPHELLEGRWLNVSATTPEGVLSSESARRLGVSVGDKVVVTSPVAQLQVLIVGIVEEAPVAPDFRTGGRGGERGAAPDARGGRSELGPARPGTKRKKEPATPGQAIGPSLPTGTPGPATAALYVRTTLAEQINGFAGRTNVLQIALRNGVSVQEFRDAWQQRLAESRPPANLIDFAGVKAGLTTSRDLLSKLLQAYTATGMALLAAVFIIFSTLSMGVAERTRELALLRAIGLTRRQVAGMVLAESLLLALVGWAGGLVAGWGLLQLVSASQPTLFPTKAELGWWCVLLAGAAAFGGALAAAILPAWKATRVRPLDALAPARPETPARWVMVTTVVGAVLIVLNPLLTFALDVPPAARFWVFSGLAYPATVIGFMLLAPGVLLAAERWLTRPVAYLVGLNHHLLTSVLSSNLWRSLGTTLALSIGLGLYVSTQVWGYSMLSGYFPGPWLPDAIVAFQPIGLDPAAAAAVRQINGVNPDRCLPLAVEQVKLASAKPDSDSTNIARPDNVILIGLDPDRGLGGVDPLVAAEFVQGDRAAVVAKLKTGRYCVIPDHLSRSHGLTLGSKLKFIPPHAPDTTLEYEVAGIIALPGWQWFTKFSGVRRHAVFTMAMLFAAEPVVRQDFKLSRVDFFWLDLAPTADPKAVEAHLQALAELQAGGQYIAPGIGTITAFRPSARLTTTNTVREAIRSRADAVIWGMSQLPLITLAVTLLGVMNTVAASVRARRWEMGVLRANGVTSGGLFRLVLAEGLMIGLAASIVSLGFGLVAGWCGVGVARFAGGGAFTGVEASLLIPWGMLACGVGATLVACLLAAGWPAYSAGRSEPLHLLRSGRSAM